jgi:antitoxin component YwqK of YwqJK toxin-antitoxin module
MLRVQWNEVTYDPAVGPDGSYLYQGKPFTGIRYGLYPNGKLECEEEYRHGLQWGLSRGWYRSGTLRREATLYQGGLHGTERAWFEDGRLQEEREGEYGILLRERTWDKEGKLVKQYELKTSDADYQTLQLLRQTNDGPDDKPGTK